MRDQYSGSISDCLSDDAGSIPAWTVNQIKSNVDPNFFFPIFNEIAWSQSLQKNWVHQYNVSTPGCVPGDEGQIPSWTIQIFNIKIKVYEDPINVFIDGTFHSTMVVPRIVAPLIPVRFWVEGLKAEMNQFNLFLPNFAIYESRNESI